MNIFCISIFNKNYDNFKRLKLIPVGLGNNKFNHNWINDKNGKNISLKNKNFGEYTFHYNLWKNKKLTLKYKGWIGFCSYRRFWTKISNKNITTFKELENIIVNKPLKTWNNYDVILGNPLKFKKIKNIKLIKKNFFEIIKKPSMLYKKNTLEDQFRVFHGSYYLDNAINLLNKKHQKDFKKFLNGYSLYPYNMFICRNPIILSNFYDEMFPWLFRCEKLFKNKDLSGYNKIRIYGFLAERFMPFWFLKNYRVTTCPITFFDKS